MITGTSARRLAWGLWGLVLVLSVTALILVLAGSVSDVGLMVAGFGILGYSTVGALVASRFPTNPIGWLLQLTALGYTLGAASDAYAILAIQSTHSPLPGGAVAAWLNNLSIVIALAPIPLIILLFPTGRPPSPRWRPLLWLSVAAPLIGLIGLQIAPGPVGGTAQAPNPTGIEFLEGLASVLMTIGAVGSILGGFACVAALIVRLRRSRGEERQQIRWFALVGAVAALLLIPAFFLDEGPVSDALFNVFVFVIAFGVPAAIGVAILRYRLYDIDFVINKTLVYGALAGFITAVYVGVVVGIGSVFGRGDEPNLALSIIATAVVAVAFQPVRARVQHLANRLVYGKRATPLEALSDLAARMGETYASEDLLPRMARILAEGTGARPARVWLRIEDELRPAASWPREADEHPAPVFVSDGHLPTLPRAQGVAPVRHQEELLGALTVDKPQGEALSPTEERLLHDLASQAGLVLRNVRLTEELRARLKDLERSKARIAAAQDEERRRIEEDLHHGAMRRLASLQEQIRTVKTDLERDPQAATATLGRVGEDTGRALEELRDLARGIYPPLLADQGLEAALAGLARKASIPVTVEAEGVDRYSQDIEAATYFCVLEALQNVTEHARASAALIRLEDQGSSISFTVADDGVGFEPERAPAGPGIQNMSDRLAALGGEIQVNSRPGAGTTVTGTLPAARTPREAAVTTGGVH
jgi:signal transduction histidine kinase